MVSFPVRLAGAFPPIVARLAADAGASWVHLLTPVGPDALRQPRTEVMVVAPPGPVLWTDNRSDIVRAIRW